MSNLRKVVKDKIWGRVLILMEVIEQPGDWWVNGQEKTPTIEGVWYMAFPLSGGAVNVNENDMEILRDVTKEDLKEAYRNANPFAKDTLAEEFPELKEEAA